jgi:penicillin-binding protein 1C
VRARRQPGSTLKPFVYELLFEHGGTPATILDDVAVSMRGARGSTFEARDYDGRERGPVRARVALASSLNLAALDAATRVGPDRVVARLRALGMRVPEEANAYGAAVVLGGVDVSALELARAYATLARGGTSIPLSFAPVATAPTSTRVMHPEAAALAWHVLTDGAARADAFGDALTALSGEPIALKTGTSQSWRDAWAAVATRRVTTVVWLGDPAGTGMRSVSGFEAAAPVAARIVAEVTRSGVHVEAPTLPTTTTIEAPICAHSGLRAGARCSHVVQERFARDDAPTTPCDAHDIDGRFVVDARYAPWVERQRPAGVVVGQLRTSTSVAVATLRVVEPRDGTRWLLDVRRAPPSVALRATVRGVQWEVDGVALAGDRWTATPGDHRIVARSGTARSEGITVHVTTQNHVASVR